ncbi:MULTISPECIES: hypothetical protein [Sphingomonas]|uniref:hypothetical protein n=1 Tax=Sphingomonas TaxID=13687 RepID=UPI000DEFE972|nr:MULTISPECIES: hypothetical protein [Sphingomonas]
MNQQVFVGAALIGVSAFHLIPAWLTGKIPSNWPFDDLTDEAQTFHYRSTVAVFSCVGIAGVIILAMKIVSG